MAEVPAWVGWPGSGPAPGHDWLPGPKLRFVILFLTYAFLALALTVNYAYSVTFFSLAIIGMYVGLRRGFVNGLTRSEKLLMVALAAYPAVAIISYLVGTRTNVGFRILGRDLRFMLFIPIFMAIRWSHPPRRNVGFALFGGALGALVLAALQFHPYDWWLPLPMGATGTHISFGDLALLSGFLAGTLLSNDRNRWVSRCLVWFALICALGASILSGARGGWPAALLLFVCFALAAAPPGRRLRLIIAGLACATVLSAVTVVAAPSVRVRAVKLIHQVSALAWLYGQGDKRSLTRNVCPNSRGFLRAFRSAVYVKPLRYFDALRIVRDKAISDVNIGRQACASDYVYEVRAPTYVGSLWIGLKRYRPDLGQQREGILARGTGGVRISGLPGVTIARGGAYRAYIVRGALPPVTGSRSGPQPVLTVEVPRGQTLRFVPLQLRPGEFVNAVATSTVGSRVVMWATAASAFLHRPAIGHGTGSFAQLLERSEAGKILAGAGDLYEHPHNDIMNAVYSAGLLGLLSLLGVYLTPLLLRGSDRRVRTAVGATVGAWIVFGLTETMFIHSFVISYWVVIVSSLAAVRGTAGPGRC